MSRALEGSGTPAPRSTRICHLTSVHPTFDTRIFHKECVSLTRDGFEVLLVAPHNKDDLRTGVRILGVARHRHRLLRMTRTVYAVYRAALRADARLYHFHDPELTTIALLLKLRGRRIICDIHEDLPADIRSKAWLRYDSIRTLVAAFAVWLEKLADLAFDAIVAATPDIATRFTPSKTEVVRNFPMVNVLDAARPAEVVKSPTATAFVFAIGHVGGLTHDRGIREVISAIELLEAEGELWLIGDWESDAYRAECSRLKGFERCKSLGFLPLERVYGYMKCADVGLAILRPETGYLRALPTKAFEYMAMSLPVIMSDFPLWRELFHECALFVDPLHPGDIAQKMTILTEDLDLRRRLGRAGRRLVERHYSWETEATKLNALYHRLLRGDSDS